METSYHFIHQNTKNICWLRILSEVLHEVATEILQVIDELCVQVTLRQQLVANL